ncbi:MAG: CHAT domain-containing protein [Piscinibacter sp.]|uniref:CHAT domain-containing tetratricopeptide repeat protein n=1 Tax=Piscinibacter sp. TaxID=1903157 RepID=UPI00258EF0F0|nr:CHAT domain-containing tetratricopeptide repeat protein [Piscinibacter sp.]MCW5666699.1 CHAT domain-containing protein [Piscinibacter sp.]
MRLLRRLLLGLLLGWAAVGLAAAQGRDAQEAELAAAVAAAEQAQGPDGPAVLEPLRSLADLLRQRGRLAEALPLAQRALALAERLHGPEHLAVAGAANELGLVLVGLGRFAEAQALLQRSLALRERLLPADHLDIANSLNSLGELYRQAGPQAQAAAMYERALAIVEKQLGPEHPITALVLNNLCAAQLEVGRYDLALAAGRRSVAIYEKLAGPEHPMTARALSNLAEVYRGLGQPEQALPPMERAFAAFERAYGPDNLEVARLANNLAGLHESQGRIDAAIPLYERSIAIVERQLGPAHAFLANPLNNLASLYQERGRVAEALPLHRRALQLRERILGPQHPLAALSRHNIALALLADGQRDAAQEELQHSIVLAAADPAARELLWHGQSDLAQLHAAAGRSELAILWGKEAVNTLQGLRGGMPALERELQRSYLQSRRAPYDRLADLLIAQGRIAEAQEVLQMLKEAELHEGLERGGAVDPRSTRIDLTGLERERFARFYALRDRQAALAAERQALERRRAGAPLPAADAARLKEIVEQLMPVAEQAMTRFFGELERAMVGAPPEQGRPAAGVEATRLRRAVDALAASEPAAAAVGLQYLVSDERLSIVLSLPGSPPIAVQQPIGRRALHARLAGLLLQLRSPAADPALLRAGLRELHGWLVAPIEADLQRFGARTLMLSLDDQLRLLPFAALLDERGRHLVQDYTLALYNEAARQALEKPAPPAWRVAAMGLSEPVDDLPALAAVPQELAAVVRARGASGEAWLNRAFDRARLLATLNAPGYNVLHVASHFVLENGAPARSRLYLGDKSRLTLADIAREDLSFGRFDLVTFSACDTARGGGRDATGQEMESLSAKTQNQGAQAVLATLWKVDDASTSGFMQQFYALRGERGLNKAQALGAVQRDMIEGRLRGAGTDWRTPYHWAPFVLMGNWR